MTKKTSVFVYETLLKSSLREKILGHMVAGRDATVARHKEISTPGDYHTIVPSMKDSVKGKIIYVTPNELNELDRYESRYARKRVFTDENEPVWAYVLGAK
jgi:gamma-glutamylcyclotransferase (GGCT)/AIG2-like uncharacterized protein YtfP